MAAVMLKIRPFDFEYHTFFGSDEHHFDAAPLKKRRKFVRECDLKTILISILDRTRSTQGNRRDWLDEVKAMGKEGKLWVIPSRTRIVEKGAFWYTLKVLHKAIRGNRRNLAVMRLASRRRSAVEKGVPRTVKMLIKMWHRTSRTGKLALNESH